MARDLRVEWISPLWLEREAALARWRAASPDVRLAWAEQLGHFTPQAVDGFALDWMTLWVTEQKLAASVRAGQSWENLVPEDRDERQNFLDAYPGLPGAEQTTLAAAAHHWLNTTPHHAWIAPPRGGSQSGEFVHLGLETPTHLNALWHQLRQLRAELTPISSAALNVLSHVNPAALMDVLVTLPPVGLWVVAERWEDPELYLKLAHSGHVVAASYGIWQYQDYLLRLEDHSNALARNLNPFRSTRQKVGEALTLRATIREELTKRAAQLVVGIGGEQRPALLTRLAEQAAASPDRYTTRILADAATEALSEMLAGQPELSTIIASTLSTGHREGPLAAALLAMTSTTGHQPWHAMVLDHLALRLMVPTGDSDPLAPMGIDFEQPTLIYAGRLLAAWLEEDEAAVITWFEHRFAALPVRATRQEPRSWLLSRRAAFLCVLGAQALAFASRPSEQLTAVLGGELERRIPEWEWSSGLGERPFCEWPSVAVIACRTFLTAQQRERLAGASTSLWVLVQLVDAAQLARHEDTLAQRLRTDLLRMGLSVLRSLETRFAQLRRWSELGACRQRRQALERSPRTAAGGDMYGATLDVLARSGQDSCALAWQVRHVRDSYAADAFEAYALLADVLLELTGEAEWKHAVADVNGWRLLVREGR